MPRQEYVFKNPKYVVRDMLYGMKYTYPGLYIDPENKIVMLNRNRKNRVGLISGAGAGIEPFGTGCIGEGMLTAYVYGELFESPDVPTISKVIHNVAMLNQGGVLVLLMNYPHQVLNFGLAIEKARLKGINVESFVIADDCSRTEEGELVALEKNLALRTGLTGCIYVFKILGTMSTLGYSLPRMLDAAMALNFHLATIGFSMLPCTNIGDLCKSRPQLHIPEGEAVIGCSLLGDTGVRNIKADSLKGVVGEILPKAVEQCGLGGKSSSCSVLVNNLGSMTRLELYAIANEVDMFLGDRDIRIDRMYAGSVMTSLNTKGVLISLLNTTDNQEWISYMDICTEAFAWPGCRLSKVNKRLPLREFEDTEESLPSVGAQGMQLCHEESQLFQKCLMAACEEVIQSEDIINKLNGLTGNGDCGTNMRRFAETLKERIMDLPTEDVSRTFALCSSIAEEKMTGSIGSIYAIAFMGASNGGDCWVSCWEGAVEDIARITTARVGQRTLMDVLQPALEMFVDRILNLGDSRWRDALKAAVECAEVCCFKTASMAPAHGIAKYAPGGRLTNVDAGAYGVYVWLKAVYDTLVEEDKATMEE